MSKPQSKLILDILAYTFLCSACLDDRSVFVDDLHLLSKLARRTIYEDSHSCPRSLSRTFLNYFQCPDINFPYLPLNSVKISILTTVWSSADLCDGCLLFSRWSNSKGAICSSPFALTR